MKYKLYYAALEGKGDIPCLEFGLWKERLSFLQNKVIGSRAKVFILVINYGSQDYTSCTYVFDSYVSIDFMDYKEYNSRHYTFHLQEYNSYEEAYKVAFDMQEPNPLCYEPKEPTIRYDLN
jgi:hypothetical protein